MSETHSIPRTDPDFSAVLAAAGRLRGVVHRTPVLASETIDEVTGVRCFFKCENLQKVGAFKYRGASNAVLLLPDHAVQRGVATHSSGNHAAALARAALNRGMPAYIVMPENAPAAKIRAVRAYGGRITFCAPTLEARERTLESVVAATGAEVVHPYNDVRVIAGQGTAALELLEQHPDLDVVLAPVGGGGLLSGTAISVRTMQPAARVIAVEPVGADDAARSFRAGAIIPSTSPRTIADGLLTSLGDRTWPIIQKLVSDIITVDDQAIMDAMRMIWERMKLVVEPSAAVPFAAVLSGALDVRGSRVGIILSGGNLDLERLPWSPA